MDMLAIPPKSQPTFYRTILIFLIKLNLVLTARAAVDRYMLAEHFNLHVFERKVGNIDDPRELRRLAVRLHATILHQQKLYEALMEDD